MGEKNPGNPNNEDPISGKPGSHPVGAGVGTAAGASIGAAIGAGAGPIGVVGGAAIGGIAGWLNGRAIAEGVNPTLEEEYWEENFSDSPDYNRSYTWEDYQPAYKMGVYSYDRDQIFEDVEPDLKKDWNNVRGKSRMDWKDARCACRNAWNRLEGMEDDID